MTDAHNVPAPYKAIYDLLDSDHDGSMEPKDASYAFIQLDINDDDRVSRSEAKALVKAANDIGSYECKVATHKKKDKVVTAASSTTTTVMSEPSGRALSTLIAPLVERDLKRVTLTWTKPSLSTSFNLMI